MFDDNSLEVNSDLDEFKSNLKSFTSERLCEIIVTSRYLGSLKEQSLLSMEELASRRRDGENFPYEEFIETEFKKLPKFNLQLKQMSIFSTFSIFKK